MAYENMTYETILSRMMDRVTEKYPNLDTREGSILFNALAPAAVELAIMYVELDNAINESFVDTASREYILRGCKQMGMDTSVFDESAGTHVVRFTSNKRLYEELKGTRWNCDLYNYTVIDKPFYEEVYMSPDRKTLTYYADCYVICETLGTSPNGLTGTLTPIDDVIDGLISAELTECVIEGKNETSDEDIRTAYYEYVNNVATDGNIAQYKRWCSEYDGVGNCKIFPLWKGANTVKVSILTTSNRKASDKLIEEFQNYLDPGVKGMGDGVAPIGAFVTVSTATEIPISVSATIKLKDGYSDTTAINTALETYFSEISYNKSQVAYMNVGATIINVEGVESVDNLLINGGTKNIDLGSEEIPILGTPNWVVS